MAISVADTYMYSTQVYCTGIHGTNGPISLLPPSHSFYYTSNVLGAVCRIACETFIESFLGYWHKKALAK